MTAPRKKRTVTVSVDTDRLVGQAFQLVLQHIVRKNGAHIGNRQGECVTGKFFNDCAAHFGLPPCTTGFGEELPNFVEVANAVMAHRFAPLTRVSLPLPEKKK